VTSAGAGVNVANGLQAVEAMLSLLRVAGMSDQAAAWGADALSRYVTGTAVERGVRAERGWSEAEHQAYHQGLHRAFEELPATTYPNIAALLPFLTTGDGDERFRFGVEVLLNGLVQTPAPAVAP
jgi:hypothetical protein